MPRISFVKNKAPLDVASGANLMESLLKNGIPVASSCKGEGICGKCRMKIEGLLLENMSELEKNTLARNFANQDERLSCQVKVTSDICVSTDYW